MSDSSTIVASAAAGDAIDEDAITVGAVTVKRQRVRIGGLGAAELQDVRNTNPAGTDYGGVVREARVGQATMAASFPVALASDQGAVPTTVGNFPATQAISAASLPLPAGAATEASLGTDGATPPTIPGTGIRGWLRSIYDRLAGTLAVSVQNATLAVTQSGTWTQDVTDRAARLLGHVTVDNASLAVTGTFWQATQPVSGTVTANVGTTNGLALDATLTGGTVKAVARGGAKGTTTAADVTSTASGANHQPLDAILYDASGNVLLGQKAMAGSVPVAIASDQSAVPENVTQLGGSGTQLTGRPGFMPTSIWFSNGSNVMNEVGFAAGQDKLPVQLSGLINTVPTTSTFSFPVVLSPNGPIGIKPVTALGFYAVSGDTGTYGGLAANTPLFSFRWGDATRFAVILKVEVMTFSTVAASTAGITERQLIVARSFTASDTGGTALTPTLNNQKRRTSFGTSLATDIRIGNPLTAGTRTLDTNPMARALGWSALNHTGPIIGAHGAGPTSAVWSTAGAEPIKLLDAADGQDHPIVLAQNEGIIVRLGVAQPTGSTQETWVNVVWGEVASY